MTLRAKLSILWSPANKLALVTTVGPIPLKTLCVHSYIYFLIVLSSAEAPNFLRFYNFQGQMSHSERGMPEFNKSQNATNNVQHHLLFFEP